ncbi:uncharacterized protein LOC105788938 isoform X2 [Gossypium raimondii]|uniref:RING-CH-type domain-containing protein n=2 Tax=Gossypium raimondii TaxID=29730 RepID=A0A7J8NNP7_GOSRA|nr:uncharacterized protein LOC105788938 isoform X2 [Gossypium raimondii]XP_012471511.1 uncharacterized protein LOC105788938 isoform X2 [Gossypium raimondii]MBA0578536.1 hypothetical protein [Gossypium raimondii]
MGDHFVLLVDRLLTESTLEAAIESKKQLQLGMPSTSKHDIIDFSSMDDNVGSSPSKLVECRICHDDDEDLNMEIPCSCRGSLKYAHRKCVQRWCNEKGDIVCEICHQQFKPGYTAPPPLFHYGSVPMNFRGNWEISRRDLPTPHFITVVTEDRDFLETEIDDYSAPRSRSLICCRVIAITVSLSLSHTNTRTSGSNFNNNVIHLHAYLQFMVLLVLRHTLPVVISGAGDYSLTLFTLLMLRAIGIMLPIYIMVKAFTAIQRRQHHQDPQFSLDASDEESDLPQLHPPHSRLIRVH